MSGEHDDLLALAADTAAAAAALVLRMRTEGVDVAGVKSSAIDVVTAADHAAEDLIRARLLAARPHDGLLGEEGDDIAGTSGVRWVVDPIDGTVNYLYGAPEYAVSIAAQIEGRSVAAVVHAPATGAVYTATLGGGSTRNGAALRVRADVPLAERLIATGFGYVAEIRARQAACVAALLPRVRDIRRRGACALDLCAVAAGQVDGYVEEGTNLWDDAAGSLIATEAGARFEEHAGPTGRRLVICAPAGGFDAFVALCRESGFLAEG